MAGSVLVNDLAHGVRAVTLSNPEKKNAIDAGMLDALEATIRDGSGVKAWLIRSDSASAFSAGYDLKALSGFPEGTQLPDDRFGGVLDLLAAHPAPSVALVRGVAIGAGCELAIACDFRVGTANARFTFPPAKLGVVYALKGMARVRSRIGPQLARRMFLLGDTIESAEALQAGLLDAIAPDAVAGAEAGHWCDRISALSPLALRGMKRGLALLDAGISTDADYERLRRESFNSEDAREGRDAMLQRRAPKFSGK